MENLKQLIICGGGYSIKDGIQLGLWDKLQNKFTIGINFSFKWFNSTAIVFIDNVCFYNRYLKDLTSIPLIIGLQKGNIKQVISNTIFVDKSIAQDSNMAGILAMHIGVKLLKEGELFLLGIDSGIYPVEATDNRCKLKVDNKFYLAQNVTNKSLSYCEGNAIQQDNKRLLVYTHFYQSEFTHKGTGKYKFYYDAKKVEEWYKPFKEQTKIKIYNVCDNPLMATPFPKISYSALFSMLDNNQYDQNQLREYVKNELEPIRR